MIDELALKNGFSKRIKANECLIVNFDKSNSSTNGSHWICIFNSNDSNQPKQNTSKIIFLDSLGLAPPKLIEKFLRTSNKKILFNSSQLQQTKAITCGYFCVHCLLKLNQKVPIYDIIYDFTQQPSFENESKVSKFRFA